MADTRFGFQSDEREKKERPPRYPVNLQVKFRKVDPENLSGNDVLYHYAWLRDMSETGMRLDTDVFISIGQALEVYVEDKISGQSFFAMAEVVRSTKGVEYYELGLKIVAKEAV
jgi:hypothetical protein